MPPPGLVRFIPRAADCSPSRVLIALAAGVRLERRGGRRGGIDTLRPRRHICLFASPVLASPASAQANSQVRSYNDHSLARFVEDTAEPMRHAYVAALSGMSVSRPQFWLIRGASHGRDGLLRTLKDVGCSGADNSLMCCLTKAFAGPEHHHSVLDIRPIPLSRKVPYSCSFPDVNVLLRL
jgi:hypothetical protein